jgi:hypothetical protein
MDKLSAELRSINASMKSLAVNEITSAPKPQAATPKPVAASKPAVVAPPKPSTTQTQKPAPEASEKKRSLEDLQMSFPEELEARLGFEEKGEYIIIKPKQFLGSDNFAKIASAVRGMGGEYISAGKDSHFRVPKKKS